MSFDPLAPHYRWMEPLLAGRVLQRARTAHLGRLQSARRVLLVGEGPGRFLAAALRAAPAARFTCVDASVAMLRIAAANTADTSRVDFVHASLPAWRPPAVYDAVVTHCFLDCFPPDTLAAVVRLLAAATAPGAVWLVTDFSIPPAGWRRWRARAVHALMYAFFRVATRLPARRWTDPDPLLRAAGFELAARETFQHGLLRADAWVKTI